MEATFQSVLELARNDPSAIVYDSSFDKITDTLCEVCRVDGNFLSTLFQYVPSIEEIILQLTASMNSNWYTIIGAVYQIPEAAIPMLNFTTEAVTE